MLLEMVAQEFVLYNTMLKGAITKMNHNYLMFFFAPPPPCKQVNCFSEEGVNHLPSSKEGDY